MRILMQWVTPTALIAVGVAVLAGWLLPQLPSGLSLRTILGLVLILFGVHRFVASRYSIGSGDRRRYGGERKRPWEGGGDALMIALLFAFTLGSCKSKAPQESMTAGHATIGVVEPAAKLAWSLSSAFQAGNRLAFIDIEQNRCSALVDSLVNNRAEEIILDRNLLPAETLAVRKQGLKLYTYPLAYFPVYLLVHKDNPITGIDGRGFFRILYGDSTNWRGFGGRDQRITLYTPYPGEGGFEALVRYYGRLDSAVFTPCSTYAGMMELAKDDPGALLVWALPYKGLPFKALGFLEEGMQIFPDAGSIMEERGYPFRLDITYITTRNKGDVAAGYLTFIVGNIGQREVMRHGYRPASVPVRIVRIKSS